jgi:hypothetical protein
VVWEKPNEAIKRRVSVAKNFFMIGLFIFDIWIKQRVAKSIPSLQKYVVGAHLQGKEIHFTNSIWKT